MSIESGTQVHRLNEARRNEELVLAESALLGERRVAWVRLAMIALFAFTQDQMAPALGGEMQRDAVRLGSAGSYVVFAIVTLFILGRARPDIRNAQRFPFFFALVDFGFMSFQGWWDFHSTGHILAEKGAAAFGLVLCFSIARGGWKHVVFSTLLACVCYAVLGKMGGAFTPDGGTFVIGALIALGMLIGLTNRSVHRSFVGLRSRDNLSRFLPRQIVERLMAYGEDAFAPMQREVTVLFSDIRDFTRMSESLPPREVLELLDGYFAQMARVVHAHEGMVNKFLGDGMLAIWGVPERNEDHAALALRAALDMRRTLEELNQVRAGRCQPPLRIGIGVHTGIVAAGMLGGPDQHEYTVIGDAVNLASRIEGLTKALGADILVSEACWQRVNGRFDGVRVSEELVKGREAPVVVYALSAARS